MELREFELGQRTIHYAGLLLSLLCFSSQVACDNADQQARMVIQFAEPTRYRVVPGDSLSAIAKKYGIQTTDISEWNSLSTTTIEPGDMLFLWQIPEPKADPEPVLQAKVSPSARPRQRTEIAQATKARAAPTAAPIAAPRLPPGKRPTSVRNAGLFGAPTDDGGLDDGLAAAVAGLEDGRRQVGTAGMRDGAEMRGGSAERSGDLDRVANPVPHNGPYIPDTAVRTPRLARPAPKRCRTQSTHANTGEDGMYAGRGLSSTQIKAALARPLSHTRRCLPPGTSGRFGIILEVNVGCDGRVKNVYPINDGHLPQRVITCIETVLKSASFPAHDLPDGQSFQYPINYNF